jgi:hypothetical protein
MEDVVLVFHSGAHIKPIKNTEFRRDKRKSRGKAANDVIVKKVQLGKLILRHFRIAHNHFEYIPGDAHARNLVSQWAQAG